MNLVLFTLLIGAAPAGPDVAVVCPSEFREALAPWLQHRAEQGHRIALLSGGEQPEEIRDQIRRVARRGALRYVVLVGDARPTLGSRPGARSRCIPAYKVKAKVNICWGSEPEIATDNWYADLDDDLLPDVAIGRLTADTPEQLAVMIEKIVDYEMAQDFGHWRRRVNFVAGLGGFGRLADAVLEATAKKLITDGLPGEYASTMTYASWRSPYCPDPRSFCDTTLHRLNEGCLFWVYIGHGHYRTLDDLRTPEGRYRILDTRDIPRLRCQHGSPIAFFMACYTGAFDAQHDCLAEEMLRQPGAPVAIISGSRVTMPYAMAVLGTGLLKECFVRRAETVGEALLAAKRKLGKSEKKDASRTTLDLIGSVLSPMPEELAAERLEHIHLFNLIGDPLLRLRHPATVTLRVAETIEGGRLLEVEGESPIAGQCTAEVVARRDLLTFRPSSRSEYDSSDQGLAALDAVYRKANDPRWASRDVTVEKGVFRIALEIPQAAKGPGHVRVFIQGTDNFALGTSAIQLREKKAEVSGD